MRNRFPIVLGILALCSGGEIGAQVPTSLPEQAPFTLGKAQLYPLYTVDLGWSSNLYYYPDSDDPDLQPISTALTSIGPGFVLDLPFSESHARVGYMMVYRDYTTEAIDAHLDHFFVGEGSFRFSNGIEVGVRDDFKRGVLDAKVFDEGGGTTFQGDSFQANDARVSVGHAHEGRRSLEMSVYNHNVRFLERLSGFFDVDENGGDLSGEHEIRPTFRLDWELAYGRSRLSRPDTPGFPAEERTEIEESWKLGGLWLLSQGSALEFRAGWQRDETESSAPSTLSAVTGSLAYRRGVPAGAQFGVDLARDIYPAIYEDNNVYVTNRLAVTFGNDTRARVSLGGRASYSSNRFPIPDGQGRIREDRTLDGEAWIGYRLGRWTLARLSLRSESRTSSVPGFAYDVSTVEATIGFGS